MEWALDRAMKVWHMLRSSYFLRVFFPIALLLVVTGGTGAMYAMHEFRQHAENMRLADLESLRESKVSSVVGYLNNHLAKIRALSRSPLIAQAIRSLNASWMEEEAGTTRQRREVSMFDGYLHRFTEHWGYYDLFLINPDGDIIYSVKHEADFATNLLHGPYRDTPLAQAFRQAIWFLQANNSGFRLYEPSGNRPAAFLASPVIQDGRLLGVLALQIDVTDIHHLLGDLTGLGETGETVAGVLRDGKVRITVPLRHRSNSAFAYELPTDSQIAQPIILGSQGYTGHAVTRDWRNVEVIATWEYLPHLQWGVVNKIDVAEAMAGLNRVYEKSVLVLLLALLCAFWIAFFISWRVVVPVTLLSRATRRFAAGHHEVRIPGPFPANELGALMRDVNDMMEKVGNSERQMQRMLQRLEQQNAWLDQKIAEKTERLEAVIRYAVDAIITLDVHGQVEMVNPAACRIFGYTEKQMLRLRIGDLFSSKNPCRRVLDLFHYMPDDCQDVNQVIEMEGVRKNGECFAMEVSLSDMRGHEIRTGNPVFLMMARDVSAAKKMREQMEHTQRLESLGVLAGGIAHDFNNLLTAIMGNAALAQAQVAPGSAISDMLARIEGASEKAAQLCRQMLAYSGKGRFVVHHIDLNALVREMISLLEVSIHKSTVLRLDLSRQELPPVMGDASQLQQVVMNLVINASEALGGRSGIVVVRTGVCHLDAADLVRLRSMEASKEGYYVTLEVSDSGCGMDEETMERLFDPFFTTKFTGRGLGMSATQGIVRGHRGMIHVESEPGKGSTFRVYLPVAEDAEPPADGESERRADESEWRGKGTILIIDDEETIRSTASLMLQRIGFDTLVAQDGERGLAVFRRHGDKIRAVLLDMTMPGLSGEQTFAQLRSIDPSVRIILSSGYNEQEAIGQFAGKGLSGFIQKPYSLQTLRKKLRQFLDIPPQTEDSPS